MNSLQSNSSKTAAWTFLKLCWYLGHILYMYILPGNSDFIIFLCILALLNLEFCCFYRQKYRCAYLQEVLM